MHIEDNCRTETRQVVILNMNASKKILPKTGALLALQMQTNPTTELTVAILEPLCHDLGLENWWKSVVNMNMMPLNKNPSFTRPDSQQAVETEGVANFCAT